MAACRSANEIFLNGERAASADLRSLALGNYGHFTSMQVRDGAVQGLELHYRRLESATLELFCRPLERGELVATLRLALKGRSNCSLRVTVFAREFDYRQPMRSHAPDVLVSVGSPSTPPPAPQRLKSYPFLRPVPHLKHVATFPSFHYRRLALRDGYDDALFVGPGEDIAEGTVWNIGFQSGGGVVWPTAPALPGTAAMLLEQGLRSMGVEQEHRAVALGDIRLFDAAFACNASGVWQVQGVDEHRFRDPDGIMPVLERAMGSRPWQPI